MDEEERQIQGSLEQDYDRFPQDDLILKTEEVIEKIRKRGWHITDMEQGTECSTLLIAWIKGGQIE